MTLAELEAAIRDRINDRRKQHDLLGRPLDWNRLCSALDVLGDTELALTAYLNHPPINDDGLAYLHVYGALQLLQAQQDAAAKVCLALGLRPSTPPTLPDIRQIRSSSVGHSPEQKENKVTRSHFIVRASLSQHSFELTTVYSDNRPYGRQAVSIPTLIAKQREALAQSLSEVIQLLDKAELEYRERHRSERLADCFPQTLSYHFGKVFETIPDRHLHAFGMANLRVVIDSLAALGSLLEKREVWSIYDTIQHHYELLEYPIAELMAYFSETGDSTLNEKDAFIFASFVQQEIRNLHEFVRELDEKYSETPGTAG